MIIEPPAGTTPSVVEPLPPEVRPKVAERVKGALEPFVSEERKEEAVDAVLGVLRAKIEFQQQTIAAEFRGQFPPPGMVEKYEQILPGAFERMMRMAEKGQDAEIQSARDVNRRDDRYQLCALGAGFIGLLVILYAAYQLALANQPWVAGGVLGIGVSGIIATLVNAPFSFRADQRLDEIPKS